MSQLFVAASLAASATAAACGFWARLAAAQAWPWAVKSCLTPSSLLRTSSALSHRVIVVRVDTVGGAAAGQVRGQPPLESAGLVLPRADERLELVLGQRGTHRPKLAVQVRGAHLPPGVACPPLAGGVGELAEPCRALPLHGGVAVGDGRARGPLRVPIVCLDEQLIRAALPQAVRLREDAVPHVEERLRVGNQRGERGGRQALQHGTAALAVRTQHRARAAAVSAVAAAPRQVEAVRAARERGGLGRGLVYLWPHVPVTGAR
eukprot:scaffold43824_cov66-Phaeocystis_antarctica.AAC.1